MNPPSAETIEWLRRLVAHRTVAGESNLPLIEDIRSALERLGVSSVMVAGTRRGTVNLFATIGPSGPPPVVLAAHTDVVAAAEHGWHTDPFQLMERESRLYGRGTTDMKGFIAVVLAALPGIVRAPPRSPIVIALSCDEEMGAKGVGPMLDVLTEQITKPSLCIIGEPTGMRVATAHKGKVAFRITVHGRSAHSSDAARGVNAIVVAALLIKRLYAYQRRLEKLTDDQRFAVPHPSINVGWIQGGRSVNVVADCCSFDVEIRATPQQDIDLLLKPIMRLIDRTQHGLREVASEAAIQLEINARYPGLDERGPLPRLLAELAETDSRLALNFGTEAGLYKQRLQAPTIICGPGDIAQAHTVNEYIDRHQLAHAERFIDRLICHMRATAA